MSQMQVVLQKPNYLFIANAVNSLFSYVIRFTEQIDTTVFCLGPSIIFANVCNKIPLIGPKDEKVLPVLQNFLLQQVGCLLRYPTDLKCYGQMYTVFSNVFLNRFKFYPIATGYPELEKFEKYLQHPNVIKGYSYYFDSKIEKYNQLNIEFFDTKKLWDKKTSSEKERILDIFGITKKEIDLMKSRPIFLTTQTLYEDGFLSYNDTILLYKRIMENYDEREVIIKPHPRDFINWSEIFPQALVINRFPPTDLLFLLFEPKRVVTFCSGSVFKSNLNPAIVDIYAKDFHKLKMYHPNRYKIVEGIKYRSIYDYDIEERFSNVPFNWMKIPDIDHNFYWK